LWHYGLIVDLSQKHIFLLVLRCGALVQVGVETMNKDTKYVLFLDDDVRLHPGSIGALTAEMKKNPDV
jgi:hypothetical protein